MTHHHDADHPEIEALWRGLRDRRSVAVTAARPGEGTSLVSRGLWRRAEAAGRTALLIHAGGEPSAAPRRLGNGPLGAWTPDAARVAEWREPARLRETLEAALADWDMVILDAPALLDRAPRPLPGLTAAAAAEATLLVVLAGRTPASALREARTALDAAGARLAGVVMNDQHHPTLAQELERQAQRFARLAPRLTARLTRMVRGSTLLTLRV
jgi:Mrp family chromosome partitioning ATPase